MSESGTPRPRLLVLASTYPRWPGDPEPGFVHELSKRLTREFDITVLCPHATGAARSEVMDGVRVLRYRYAPEPLEKLVNDGGIVSNIRRSPWRRLLVPLFVMAQLFVAWRLVRQERPHVIHAHWLIPQGLVAANLRLLMKNAPPFLVTSHGTDLYGLRDAISRRIKRFVLRHASGVTVVSEAMRAEVAKLGADAGRVKVQPMGVDLRERFMLRDDIARLPGRVLFVGRLVEGKGVRCLLDAMPAVIEAVPNATLDIAGFGPEEHALRLQVDILGLSDKVRFLGAISQSDLPLLYSEAAVCVAPFIQSKSSQQEGLGLVMLEAAGCGCPVVVSRLPTTLEVIDAVSGIHGVAAGQSEALARGIIDVLRDGSVEVDRGALMRFDWDARALAYADMLMRVARP